MEVYYTKDSGFSDEVPLIPATMAVAAEKPRHGWWRWHFSWREESFRNGEIVRWDRSDRARRVFRQYIACSASYDPLPDIHDAVGRFEQGRFSNTIEINVFEEGPECFILFKELDNGLVHAMFERVDKCRDMIDERFCYNFLLTQENVYEQMRKGYATFGKYGGTWGYIRELIPKKEPRLVATNVVLDL